MAGGVVLMAGCAAQKSVTRAVSSAGHSSEGRARDPVRMAERAYFIAAAAAAHSASIHRVIRWPLRRGYAKGVL